MKPFLSVMPEDYPVLQIPSQPVPVVMQTLFMLLREWRMKGSCMSLMERESPLARDGGERAWR